MSDSFMHYHQSALDNQMEDNAIQDLQDAGIYPDPDNDLIYEKLYEEVLEENPNIQHDEAVLLVYSRWNELPVPDDKDYPHEEEDFKND